MIYCKKHVLAACFSLLIPVVWAEAPVVDDSDNFAILDEQHAAVRPRYDEPQIDRAEMDDVRNEKYQTDMLANDDDGPALAHDDALTQNTSASHSVNDNATLVERVQTLQQEVQQLRGQMEVQAHELSALKEQQSLFYKDLDSRLGARNGLKSPTTTTPTPNQSETKLKSTTAAADAVVPASHANPADEQISYLAAYELVKNKQYDNALKAMQAFVQKYPQSGFGANAHYWLGELLMVKKDYPHAIEHFDMVLTRYPSSNKSASSLLKTGYAYAASGHNQEAIQKLQQVVSKYPGTSTAQLANLKLEALNAM